MYGRSFLFLASAGVATPSAAKLTTGSLPFSSESAFFTQRISSIDKTNGKSCFTP